jgi:hypothetical protein
MIVRDGFVVYRSPILQHYFDCPFQFGTSDISDTAENAELFEIEASLKDRPVKLWVFMWNKLKSDQMVKPVGVSQAICMCITSTEIILCTYESTERPMRHL